VLLYNQSLQLTLDPASHSADAEHPSVSGHGCRCSLIHLINDHRY